MPEPKPLPPKDVLCALFDYDPEAGTLRWRARPISAFATARAWKSFNTRRAGREAGGVNAHGYIQVRFLGGNYYAHRLIWKMVHGTDPIEVDHENHNTGDNRLTNLRAVSHRGNGKNTKLKTHNKTGINGVQWLPKSGKWRAFVCSLGRTIHLGEFQDKASAAAARLAYDAKHQFHHNHGQAVRV